MCKVEFSCILDNKDKLTVDTNITKSFGDEGLAIKAYNNNRQIIVALSKEDVQEIINIWTKALEETK